MPNWIDVTVFVEGENAELGRLGTYFKRESNGNSEFTLLSQVVPPPREETDVAGWCISNWGSERDFFFEVEDEGLIGGEESSKGYLMLSGVTAWRVPVRGFEAVKKMFPDLMFQIEYSETHQIVLQEKKDEIQGPQAQEGDIPPPSPIVSLIRRFDEHPPVVLGKVQDQTGRPSEVSLDLIDTAWERFKGTKPDCDSEFVTYLCDTYGFVERTNWVTETILE